jgi:uncharacterized protein YndB with AHSA1/START domain
MARIKGEVIIRRPPDVVFDYVADQRNEPQYNPRMVRTEKITEGPVGQGTVFRSAVAFAGRTADMRIECTAYERPMMLASTTTMRQAVFTVNLTFEPVPAGTRMRWSEQVRPRGGFRLLTPVITRMGRRQERTIWASMKQHLEAAEAPPAPAAPRRRAAGNPSNSSHRPLDDPRSAFMPDMAGLQRRTSASWSLAAGTDGPSRDH